MDYYNFAARYIGKYPDSSVMDIQMAYSDYLDGYPMGL